MPRFASLGSRLHLIALLPLLGGCVANSSNPIVAIRQATMGDDRADLVLHIENPGGRELTVDAISYELSHGEMGLPLASDGWRGELMLPAGGGNELTLAIIFDTAPIEDDSTHLMLSGSLTHTDHTGFLGMRSMDLNESAFRIEFEGERKPQ